MNLQYQLGNGNWADCGERADEFLSLAINKSIEITSRIGADKLSAHTAHYATVVNAETATTVLLSGKHLAIGTDWYAVVRNKPAPRPTVLVELVRCTCGHSVPTLSVMSASLGTSCPDCYDRMSD